MKILLHKSLRLLFALLLCQSLPAIAQNWVQKQAMSKSRFNAVSFALNGKVYVGGGNDSRDLWEYDPAKNSWTQKADLPGPSNLTNRASAITFVANGKAYIGLGADHTGGSFYKDMWEYDTTNDKWTQKKDLPGIGREGAGCFVINNKAYIVGGAESYRLSDTWEYDPAMDNWAKKASSPLGALIYPFAFSTGGKGYIAGGDAGSTGVTNKMYAYDPASDSWTARAPLPVDKREQGISFVINDIAYCGLGDTFFTSSYTDMYSYNAATNTWTKENDFPGGARTSATASVIGNKAYAGMGSNNNSDWWEFTAPTGISQYRNNLEITCYPNPAKQFIYLQPANMSSTIQYSIYNCLGQKLLSGIWSKNYSIDISSLSKGNYIAEMTDNEKTGSINIVVK